MRRQTVALVQLLSALAVAPRVVNAQVAAPTGWTSRADGRTQILSPTGLVAGAAYSVAVFAEQLVSAGAREPWIAEQADADVAAASGATVEKRGVVNRASSAVLSTSRILRLRAGAQLLAVYYGVESAAGTVRLIRVLATSPSLLQAHQSATTEIVRAVAQESASSSTATVAVAPQSPVVARTPVQAASAVPAPGRISSDVIVKTPAPRRNAFRAGGPFVAGMYVGQQVYTDTRKVINQMTLWLYPNGEYRQQWKGSSEDPREDEFAYDPSTGRIDLAWGSLMTIVNSRIEPDADFAVLGRTDDGKPALLAENDRGFHTVLTLLVYAGPNDRPPPSAVKAAAAAAEAEAARYKHVVAAGQGIQDAQIAGVYLHSTMHQTMGLSFQLGVTSTLSVYVLLTDGTIHDGLPVAPDEMDVSASRRREPQTWGRWRRQGDVVQVAWNVAPDVWKPLEGERMRKASAGDVLRGRFGGGESSAAGDMSSFSLYGVTFLPGQRFETDSRGGNGTGSFTQTMSGTSVQTTRDDEGSVTSATVPGGVVSSTRSGASAARSGTYRISGWNLEARFDDGRVVRQPFFFLDDKRDALYWQGKVVNLDTDRR